MSEQTQTPEAPATRRFVVTVHELKTYATEHTVTVELPEGSTLDAKAVRSVLQTPRPRDAEESDRVEHLFGRDGGGDVCSPNGGHAWAGGVRFKVLNVEPGESERIAYDGTAFVVQSVAEVEA